MRFTRNLVAIALSCVLLSIVSVCGPATALADPGACTKFVGGLQALLCVNQNARAYGIFTTFIYPDVSHDRGWSTTRNITRFYTDPVNGEWIELGIRVEARHEGGVTYQPYWYAHPHGPATRMPESTVSDRKVHTFMAIPHCSGCKQWDVFYDFDPVGTTPELSSDMALYMSTGWHADYDTTAIGRTRNRVKFLNGNRTFEPFSRSTTSTLVSTRLCSSVRCTWYDTSLSLDGDYVSSWDVALNSSPAARFTTPSESLSSSAGEREVVELERRAQQIVDERLHRQP